MENFIDRSLNAQQLFTKGHIDYDDYCGYLSNVIHPN